MSYIQTKYEQSKIIYTNKNMKLKYNNSKKSIILNGTTYKAYSVCDLPNNFGFHDKEPIVHLRTKDAVTEWFNYAGLTYIAQ